MEKLYNQVECLIVRDPTLRNSRDFLPKLPEEELQSVPQWNKVSSGEWSEEWQDSSLSGTRLEALSSLFPLHFSFALPLFVIVCLPFFKKLSCCLTWSHPCLFLLPLGACPYHSTGWKCPYLLLRSLLDCHGCFSTTSLGAGSLFWDVAA